MKAQNYNISPNMGNWEFRHNSYGVMMVDVAKYTAIYVQNGIARVYHQAELTVETEVGYMKPAEFNEWLLEVEKEYN